MYAPVIVITIIVVVIIIIIMIVLHRKTTSERPCLSRMAQFLQMNVRFACFSQLTPQSQWTVSIFFEQHGRIKCFMNLHRILVSSAHFWNPFVNNGGDDDDWTKAISDASREARHLCLVLRTGLPQIPSNLQWKSYYHLPKFFMWSFVKFAFPRTWFHDQTIHEILPCARNDNHQGTSTCVGISPLSVRTFR